jgi:glutamyl-tRNA reductase
MGAQLANGLSHTRTLFAVGINHKTAPVEVRERLHLREDEIPAFLGLLRQTLSECVVLSTCNRTEIYGVSEFENICPQFYENLLAEFKGAGEVKRSHFFEFISCAATQQLFNVSTSIDSRVIGDSQILRQLRCAYDAARQQGCTGKVLNTLMQRAFRLGKTTYTETSIHDGAVSVSLAAVELGVKTFGSLRSRTALVIGAGEMARCTAEALVNKHIGRIIFVNRTRSRAEQLAASLDTLVECEVADLADFKMRLNETDMIFSSTASDGLVLTADDLSGVDHKMLVVDIAVPRDVDPAARELPNIMLRNIDDLRTVIDGHHERRLGDLPKVKRMIVDEMVEFLVWYYSLPMMPATDRTVRPTPEVTYEILQVKKFLNQNLSEIHRLAARSGGDFYEDLASHFSLIEKLQSMKAGAQASAAL